MRLSEISPVVWNVGCFTSCAATPNSEAVKTAYTYRFMYLSAGSATLTLREKSRKFKAGGILFLLPGERYRILNSDGDFSVTNIFFDFTRARICGDFPKWHLSEPEFDPELCGVIENFEDTDFFRESKLIGGARPLSGDIDGIRREATLRRGYRAEYLGVLLHKLILDVLRLSEREIKSGGAASEIAGYIEENIRLPLGAKELGERFGYSPDHVGRMMREFTGTPLHEYVLSRKIDRARLLLRETDLTVADVAQYLGFSDSSHFSRVFRRLTGTKPSDLRL